MKAPQSPPVQTRSHSLLATLIASAALLTTAAATSVSISSPTEAATIAGQITITGTAADLGATGRVSVSIDSGPFTLAQGTTNWSKALDTTTLTDGPHTITARARLNQQDPNPAFHTINVTVTNTPTGLAVSITNPTEGEEISTTLTVTGTSHFATAVSLQIDSGPFTPVNGLANWNVIIEEGALSLGAHTLTVQATDGTAIVTDSVNIIATSTTSGLQDFTYLSSVDGVSMNSKLYVPTAYNPATPTGLVVHLHGGGGLGNINSTHQAELDARGWIGISPDGRVWGLASMGCSWGTSAAYVDSFDPNVGPGEQDIFDAIQWAIDNFNIDADRIYLSGHSMGGRGTYAIGLKNPDYFAAIFTSAPAIDMYEIFERRPEPAACKEGMVMGQPGDSPLVDTFYTITSGRFLIENACNLPVFHGHGTIDRVPNNDPTNPATGFLHGSHILFDPSWSGCYGDPALGLCFGHTPTLSELHALHPGGYDWAYMFTEVAHIMDSKWLQGTPIDPTNSGIEDPANPGNLIGAYQFFDSHTRIHSPDTVVYKSYTDTHRQAYWTDILIDTPWMDIPGAIRATKNLPGNAIDCELVRVHTAGFDLDRAGFDFTGSPNLTINLDLLNEPVYDPALAPGLDTLAPKIVLTGDFTGLTGVAVTRDGVPLSTASVEWSTNEVRIASLAPITTATTLVVTPQVLPLAFDPPTPAECAAMIPGTPLPFPNAIAPATLDFPADNTIELWIIGHSENRGYDPFLQQMLDANPIAGKTFIVRNDWIGGHEAHQWATPGSAGYNKIETHLAELTHPTIALILTSNNASFPIGTPNQDDPNYTQFIDNAEAIADHLHNGGSGVAMSYFSNHRYKSTNTLPSYYEKFALAALVERFEQSGRAYLKAGPAQHDLHYCFYPDYYAPDDIHTNALGDELMAQTWYHFLEAEFAASPPGDSFTQWMLDNGFTDPDADPDQNGLTHALTYSIGADLVVSPHSALPDAQIIPIDTGGGVFEDFAGFTYSKRATAPDLTARVWRSIDLMNWTDVTGSLIVANSTDNGNGTTTITLRESTPLAPATSPSFYRATFEITP